MKSSNARLVIVSNRLPFTVSMVNGEPRYSVSSGGLTTGLWSYLHQAPRKGPALNYLWVGWPGCSVPPEQEEAVRRHAAEHCHASPVFLPQESMDRFYHGFCNKTIWPLFHYFPTLSRNEESYWREYKDVNELFGEVLMKVLRPDDLVWVHDYQLMLLPRMVRGHFPDMPIGFFLHIPFPSYEIFRQLPRAWREEIIEGLLGASLIGFHTHDYTRDFLKSVLRTTGHEHHLGSLTLPDHLVKVDTFPMGIDFQGFARAAQSAETAARVQELRATCGGRKVIFSVDRLDYTKGLINRLRGYNLFLKKNPQWHGKVVFIVSVAPSRIGVESYQAMKEELEQTVGRIIGAHGDVSWTPLIYQYRNLHFDEIVALYRLCDVALITPLRDGMNLVAKEFIASRVDQTGVLILSEMAGAAKELGEALLINPFHAEDFTRALEQALVMPVEEQIQRNQLMQERLRRYDVNRWAEDFVQAMIAAQSTETARRACSLSGKAHVELVRHYAEAGCRALLLDYDGTLVPFVENPKAARPDDELVELMRTLGEDPANDVLVVSGRPRTELEAWFGDLPVALAAEHGVWLRRKNEPWRMHNAFTTGWKDAVRPILQLYVDRLPGALLEEKEFSLAWHHRRADPEQAAQRANELLDDLSSFTRNIDVQVLVGHKVIEIRNTGVSKGTAALEWLGTTVPDFILGIGDDLTDEDLFRTLPADAYTVRVGFSNTAARYHLGSHVLVRRLLRELAEISRNNKPVPEAAELCRAQGELMP